MSAGYSERFQRYKKAVIGSARANHTFYKRLDTIKELGRGLNGNILDIGCGYGFRTIGLSEQISGDVVGVDTDKERIAEAETYVKENKIENCRFETMDAARLAFKSSSFDVIVADEMIHHVEDLSRVLREMYRVLRKGGVAVISDHNKWSVASELVRFAHFGSQREKLFSAKEIASRFKKTGFNHIKSKHILFTLPFHHLPKTVMKWNYRIENCIEKTPLLKYQCGVYVVRGVK